MKKSFFVFVAAFFLQSSMAVAQDPGSQYETPVTPEFNYSEMHYTGELGLVYAYHWDIQVVNGYVAICGVGFLREHRARQAIRRSLREATLESGGAIIHEDMTFFGRARNMNRLPTSTATCLVTGHRPQRNVGFVLNFAGRSVRF